MQNNTDVSAELVKSSSLKTPTENTLLRLAKIFIKIDEREHILDRKQFREEV